ncbi:MAG: hypothetical protein ACJ73S_13895 [Mycobacteriales bacterium]
MRGPAGSAVLKLATPRGEGAAPWLTSDDPGHWNYWRRETEAYRSGWAHTAYTAGGLVGPALLDSADLPDGAVALWLEDVPGAVGGGWTVAGLVDVAHRLGVAQAGWVGDRPRPPWLSRRWLRQYVDSKPTGPPVGHACRHPVLAGSPPRRPAPAVGGQADAAEPGRAAAAYRLPPEPVADEPGRRRLAGRPAGLGFTGDGALGEDVANLVVDTVADGLLPVSMLPELMETLPAAYLAGLREAGWHGDPDRVRAAVAVTGAARYCWFAPSILRRLATGGRVGSPHYDPRATPGEALAR